MQISEHMTKAAEEYRQARDAWFSLNIDAATRRQADHAEWAFRNAATRLADLALDSIDREARR